MFVLDPHVQQSNGRIGHSILQKNKIYTTDDGKSKTTKPVVGIPKDEKCKRGDETKNKK